MRFIHISTAGAPAGVLALFVPPWSKGTSSGGKLPALWTFMVSRPAKTTLLAPRGGFPLQKVLLVSCHPDQGVVASANAEAIGSDG